MALSLALLCSSCTREPADSPRPIMVAGVSSGTQAPPRNPFGAGRRSEAPPTSDGYQWTLPRGLPVPRVPADNPMTEPKVALGRRLFYDRRLSGNGQFACATCHQQQRAFTDGKAHAIGSTGGQHARNTMSLANVAYNLTFGWADESLTSLELQMAIPLFNEHPIEMGLQGRQD